MLLTAPKLPMDPDRRLALQTTNGIGHTLLRGNAETPVHVSRHRVPLHQLKVLLLAQLPQQRPNPSSQRAIDDTASVLWDKNYVILAVPADVRLALPCSPGDLLASERGGSSKGGLLHFCARRNGRAPGSLTARGGGLPYVSDFG